MPDARVQVGMKKEWIIRARHYTGKAWGLLKYDFRVAE